MPVPDLFSVIPDRFFSVLASPLKKLYAEVLFRLYDQYLLTNFGIPREVAVDIIVDYLETGGQKEWEQQLEEESWEEGADSNTRNRASFLLRKLAECEWLVLETYHDYSEYITLADYAIQVLETLDRVRKNYRAEYQGYVYATYTLLNSPEAEKQGHLALEKAREQTAQLMNGLKTLNHNIKRYIDQVLQEKTPQEILRLHFQDYQQSILDKSYHRLKTSDHVSRYRPKIVDKINQWSRNHKWLKELAKLEVQRERYPSEEEALQGIHKSLDFIATSYLNMDSMLEEIDRRNSQYASASYTTLRFALTRSKNLEGQILEILKYLALLRTKGEQGKDDLLPGKMSPLFNLFQQEFLDSASLYTPRNLGLQHRPQELNVLSEPDPKRQQERLARTREVLAQKLTREKINRYIIEKIGERPAITASQLGINEVDDLLKLIYAAAYSPSAAVDYTMEFDNAPPVTGGEESFRFRDVTIKRKKGG